jgi:hypothetical protein
MNQGDPYKSGRTPSRAALRNFYGAAQIGGPSVQAAADTTPSGMAMKRPNAYRDDTPSGRMRTDAERGIAPNPAADLAAFRKQFTSAPQQSNNAVAETAALADFRSKNVRPFDIVTSRTSPATPLESVQQAPTATPKAPDYSLMPQDVSVPNIADYVSSVDSFSTPKAETPSILDGSNKWLSQAEADYNFGMQINKVRYDRRKQAIENQSRAWKIGHNAIDSAIDESKRIGNFWDQLYDFTGSAFRQRQEDRARLRNRSDYLAGMEEDKMQ